MGDPGWPAWGMMGDSTPGREEPLHRHRAGDGLKGPRESLGNFIHNRQPKGGPCCCHMWNARAVASVVPVHCQPTLGTLS